MRPVLLLGLLVFASGCTSIMGGLRQDLRDADEYEPPSSPTVGGRWTEGGFLSDDLPESGSGDRYAAVGHSERSPASESTPSQSDSWMTPDEIEANRRDNYRPMNSGDLPVLQPLVRRMYKNGDRATREDFIDDSPNEGSLWASSGQTNYYFTKNKVRSIGDIVTINLEPEAIRDIALEVRRTLSPRERDLELSLAQARLRTKALGLPDPDTKNSDALATSAAAAGRAPASTAASNPPATTSSASQSREVEVPRATLADIDVLKSLDIKPGEAMMGEIIERYPNGNYKIRAVKRILYRNGPPRLVSMVGVVKGADISEDDKVGSGKLYEYRIEALH